MNDHFDTDHYDDEMEGICCPRCDGYGTVSCYCGGDLCICENYGDATCPLCIGEGTVSHADEQRYLDARQKHWDDYQAARASYLGRAGPKPSAKRAKVKAARKQRHRK